MRSGQLKPLVAAPLALAIMLGLFSSARAEEAVSAQGKKYPHPHTLHLSVMSQRTPDFSANEIRNWPEFVRSLQGRLQAPPFQALLGPEARMLLGGIKPGALTEDDKTAVVDELNRLLADETVGSRTRSSINFSRETKEREAYYKKTQNPEDLKWLNRGIINDLFPQTSRKKKGAELKQITCITCHEAYKQEANENTKEPAQTAVSEGDVMDCFSAAVAGGKTMDECIAMANKMKRSRIEPYGPLKNYIQRSNPDEMNPYLIAVHPEAPYTFKPLLKRLVCIECHSSDRKVDKITGRDGKIKEIPMFYGAESGKHKHKHE